MGIICDCITPAYGYTVRLATANQLYSISSPVILDTPGPLNDVVFVPNGLQVLRSGTYHVQYTVTSNLVSTDGDNTFIQLAIQVNEDIEPIQYFSRLFLSAVQQAVQLIPQHGSAILNLNEGDIVQIRPLNIDPPASYQNAYLQLIQII
jgi:hypothetical protein